MSDIKLVLQPLHVGASAGEEINFDLMKAGYFAAMGWDLRSGRPYPMTWRELELDELL
jgi:aldehyde:ferredoxin oxidoreductase